SPNSKRCSRTCWRGWSRDCRSPPVPEVTLPDRRVLALREYGDPKGRPVVCNHGGLVSGQDVSPADAAARALNVRLISPDRPGIGASTPRPGRTTRDWADDVGHMADALGLDRFG